MVIADYSEGFAKLIVNKNENDSSGLKPNDKWTSDHTLKNLFEIAPTGYVFLDSEGTINNINPAAIELMGLNDISLIHKPFVNQIFNEDQDIFIKCIQKLFETRVPQICDLRICQPDGQKLWLRLNLMISHPEDGYGILMTLTDVTFQQQVKDVQSFLLGQGWSNSGMDFFEALAEYLAVTLNMDYVFIDRLIEKNLEAQTIAVHIDGKIENNIRYTLEDTPCGQVVEQEVCCFPKGVCHLFPRDIMLKNLSAESYAGITLWGSREKPIGLIAVIGRKPIADPSLTEIILKQVSIRAGNELEYRQMEETIMNSRDELALLVKSRTAELQKTNQKLKKEIRKRRQKEKSLVLAEEKYRTVADFTYDWETWVGPDGEFIYVSPSCKPTTGYTVEEFMNDSSLVIKITHPEDRELVQNHYNEKRRKNLPSCSLDFRIITRDGEERWIGHSCQPVFDAHGNWIGQRGSNRDITDRKRIESFLIDSHKKLRTLSQRIDAIAEEERIRISREIHDELGHLLTALKFDIEDITNKPHLSHEKIKSELSSLICVIDALIDSVRKITSDLRPGILDHLGLFPAIEWQVEQFQKRTRISCDLDLDEMNITFDKNETTIIFRILQEILTNIARHSKADKVTLSLNKTGSLFIMKVTDNGVGFDLNNINYTNSLGLMGMQERALSIGGEIIIESETGKGTSVSFLLKKK